MLSSDGMKPVCTVQSYRKGEVRGTRYEVRGWAPADPERHTVWRGGRAPPPPPPRASPPAFARGATRGQQLKKRRQAETTDPRRTGAEAALPKRAGFVRGEQHPP